MAYKFLEHTADLKIEVKSGSLEEGFKESAMALKQAIAEDVKVKKKIKKKIKINSKDLKSLLYSYLEEFLFLLDAEDFLIADITDLKLRINSLSSKLKNDNESEKKNYQLQVVLTGDKASNYKFSNNVKAITYNDMLIDEKKEVRIVFVVDV